MRSKLIILLSIFFLVDLSAQVDTSDVIVKTDSTVVKHNRKKEYAKPRKATIMSAVLPGLGQAYNRKAWKIPIIYAGLGGFGYLFYFNQTQFNVAHKYLKAQNDGDSTTINPSGLTSDQLLVYKTQYRKRRDIGVIGFCAMYLLNIVDANVDAHLRTFDVSDDLSLQIKPWEDIRYSTALGYKFAGGVTFKFTLK